MVFLGYNYNDALQREWHLVILRRYLFGESRDDGLLDSALVVSSADAEETGLSPVSVPRVGDQPVRGSVVSSPAEDLDGVTSLLESVGVLQGGLVVRKVVCSLTVTGSNPATYI